MRKRLHPALAYLWLVLSQIGLFLTWWWRDAVSPQGAVARYGKPLPAGWPAGVMNHGRYEWWFGTTADYPIAYAVTSVAMWVAVIIGAVLVLRARMHAFNQ